jgi:hypothetical protein
VENDEDVFADYHKSVQDAKLESFEGSTLALILRQLGKPAAEVKRLQRELDEGFSFSWFNGEGFLPFEVYSTRIFRFNFADLFFTPSKSPLVEHFIEEEKNYTGDFALVFRVYSAGRVVATSFEPRGSSVLRVVARKRTIYFTPFTGFFSEYEGGT